jgi:hypothetical protein
MLTIQWIVMDCIVVTSMARCIKLNGMPTTPRQVVEALKHRYINEESSVPNVDTRELALHIREMSSAMYPDDIPLIEIIASEKTDWILSGADIAVLHSVSDCMKMIFQMVNLEPEVSALLKSLNNTITSELLLNPALPTGDHKFSILSLFDLLLDATIGWSNDLGRAGDQLIDKVAEIVESLKSESQDYKTLETELAEFLGKEQKRINKLEERLAATESGKFHSQRCRIRTAEMINTAMKGKQLTPLMAGFLKGSWFESIQLLSVNEGFESEDWQRAEKMTETIIWTYQSIDEESGTGSEARQRLYRIVEHLPSEIRNLLISLEHNTEDAEAAMQEIETEQVEIVSGQQLQYEPFEPLKLKEMSINEATSVSRILLRKVTDLQPGQWFSYDEDGRRARVKLALKLDDVKQMVFTNRNGMKALQTSFDEMAYVLSSSVIKPLNHQSVLSSTFSSFFQGSVDEHQRKLKLAEEADQQEAMRIETEEKATLEARVLAREEEEAEADRKQEEHESRLEQAKSDASKSENQALVTQFEQEVSQLNIGAWLKLPGLDGTPQECKLVVKVAAAVSVNVESPLFR